jgi:hypothetical protein
MLTFICTSVYWLISTLFFCPEPLFIIINQNDDEFESYTHSQIDHLYLESIANDSIEFLNHYEVGAWLNDKYLYEQLDRDKTLRNSTTALQNFYSSYQNSVLNAITNADRAFAVMSDNATLSNYATALQNNNSISSIKNYEVNEQWMNNLALAVSQNGITAISNSDKINLEVLANACPYEEGTAVFKARMLWALFNPAAQYNDRLNCLPQAQNRSSNNNNNTSTNLDSLLEMQVSEEAIKLVEHTKYIAQKDSMKDIVNLIQVYPNPATNYVFVRSPIKENGVFELQNLLGESILKVTIKENITTIKLPSLAYGMYTYKIIYQNEIYNGKLTIKNN